MHTIQKQQPSEQEAEDDATYDAEEHQGMNRDARLTGSRPELCGSEQHEEEDEGEAEQGQFSRSIAVSVAKVEVWDGDHQDENRMQPDVYRGGRGRRDIESLNGAEVSGWRRLL